MQTDSAALGAKSVEFKWVVPRLALMMFLQFFVWGAWYVTLGVVMGKYGLAAIIGDAYSTGPIARSCRRSCWAWWWTVSSPRRRCWVSCT